MQADPRAKTLLAQVLDSHPGELRAWRNRSLPDLAVQTYVEVLIHFEESDIENLANATRYVSLDEMPSVYWLANCLWAILVGNVELENVVHLLDTTPESSPWRGEALFVAGASLDDVDRAADAKAFYQAAAEALWEMGARKKSNFASSLAGSMGVEASLNPLHVIRKHQANAKLPLTKLERALLRVLGERPLTKFEIAERIFGAHTLYHGAEARVEQALEALERKRPYSIRKDRVRYFAAS